MDIVKLGFQILAVDDSMRYVEIIGEKGESLFSKLKNGKKSLGEKDEAMFSHDLFIMKKMQKVFDESLGKVVFTHMVREKLHQLIWNYGNFIIYCTCEGNTENRKIIEIASKIESLLRQLTLIPPKIV